MFVNFSFAQLIAIDDVVIGRADNPNAATSSGDRVFLNDYFNGTAINFGTYSNFTITETIPDPSGFTTLNPLGFVNIAANTPQGIYYITYEICENANPTNCDTAEVEIRVFPTTSSSGSGSAEMSISVDSGSISCSGNVCITTAPCVDLNTGTIPPLTLSADYTEVGHSTGYDVRSIPFNPPFSFGETATGTTLTADDVWSAPINFAFDFEFYNNDYTQCALSTNGAVGFNLSDAVGAHYWTPAAGALIPNNTDAALMDGNIFGAIHDTDPSASGTLGVDYNITYSVKGEAPFRVFVFSFFNVAQFSAACNSLKTNQMIMFYETTNIIETYIFQKPICPGWAGGRAAIGIQNDAGTDGVSPPGRNTGVWDVSPTGPEAWQFYPNGGAPITSFEWLDDAGTVLGTDPNALVVTPSETTTYIAQVTYTDALTGVERVAYRPITVVVPPTPVVTLSDSPDVCGSGDAIFTITGSENDVVEYNVNGGATQTVTLDATGEHIITITGATSDQIVNLESVDNLNSVCGGPLAISETVQVFTQPNVDTPSDVTACNDYTLPALTEGDYYTGSGGTGTMLNAGDVITTTQTIYVYAESGTTPNCVDEHSFIVTIDSCTLSVTAVADMPSICNDAGADVTLTATPSPGTAVGAYSYSWTEQGDATVLGTASTLVLSPPPAVTTTYEVTLTDSGLTAPNDTATNTVTVTVNNTPTVDAPGDVTMCDTYTLPALTSGDYYTGAGGTGTLLAAGDDITTTQTIYVYGETGTTPNCFDENSFVVTINDTPVVDTPSDVTICDSYTLPALTAGTYYDAAGGTGAVLNAGDTILTTQTIYIYAETGTTPNCTAEHSFTVTVNTTPAVDAPVDVTQCNEYVLPALVNGNYYTGSGGTGTMLNAGDVITTTQTIYVYAESGTTPNCFDENSFEVTIDICNISVTAVADMPSICNDAGADVTLTATPNPATPIGAYSYSWTEQGDATVLGTASTLVLSPPPAVTTTYEVTLIDSGLTAPNDTATNTVTVTVNNTPSVTAPADVEICDSYTLPALTEGNYYTGTGGTGTMLSAGDSVTTTQTIYVYAETGTTPNCSDEDSFVVTINDTPVVDTPSDVTICDSYTLPALTAGTYYDAAGGTGAVLNAGDTILTTQTIYIYAETGTTPNCTAEHSFTVTINTTPVVDAPVDVEICDSYTLPALGNGDYYTGSGGTGTMLNAGDSVTTTQTIYVYADTGTTPNCFDENSFVVTINNTPVADAPTDVIACDSYVLPALTVGNYYTGSGGTGTMLNAGDSVTTTQTIYVYAETGTTPNCSDENSFEVTINTTPLADAPADVTECVTYTLPALINGAYYTGAGGTGTMLNAGDSITSTQTIYVYAESGTSPNCINENSFIVTINSLPSVVVPTPLVVCDDTTIDGVTEMDLTVKNDEITGNNSNYNVTYYNSSVAAQNGAPQVAPSDTAYIGTDGEVVYVRVEDVNTGCINFTTLTLNVTNGPTVAAPADLYYCDPDNDNLGIFDLSVVRDDILAVDPTLNVSFHLTYQNAIDGVNAQGDTLSNVAGQTVYVRVDYGTNSNCPTVVSVNLIVNPTPIVPSTIDDYAICDDDDDGIGSFNLTTMNGDILGSQNPSDFTLTYHETLADAEAEPAVNPITGSDLTNYQSGNTTIYVRLENNNTQCVTVGEFNLVVNPLPVIPVDAEDAIFEICDDSSDNDGYAIFDLTTRNSGLTGGNASYVVDYYETMADIPNNPIPNYSAYANTSLGGLPHNPQTIFATVTETTSGSNCYALTTVTLVVNTLPTPNDALPDLVACDDNNPGDMQEEFVLDQNEALMLNDFDETVTYHESLSDAELGDNEITNLGNYTNTSAVQTIYVRVTDTGDPNDANDDGTGCYTIVTFDLIVNPLPEFTPDNPYIICVDTNGTEVIGLPTIDTGLNPLDYTFEWLDENGVIVSIDSSYTPNLAGLYTVEITNSATGCSNIFTAEVEESAPPVLSAEVSTQAFSDPNVVVATVTGTGDYEFSIDNGPWLGNGSNSYTFTDVRFGEHLIMARDANGCGISTDTVFVLDYPLFFTPNNDGDNDTWQISGIDNQPDAKIYIFDRYGKLLKQLNPTGSGWDGTLNGKPLPSSDYWFTIEYREPSDDSRKQFQAHFTLKR
ncbi:hypothetical protein GCM10022271_12800 [Corallibacter vietnamensis]|uniref:Ig-like domain-containing protein n=1 Tax=Corallibacter vietnamensis TaxID=904130 RepID=A0ABP7H5B3_9FLAO